MTGGFIEAISVNVRRKKEIIRLEFLFQIRRADWKVLLLNAWHVAQQGLWQVAWDGTLCGDIVVMADVRGSAGRKNIMSQLPVPVRCVHYKEERLMSTSP